MDGADLCLVKICIYQMTVILEAILLAPELTSLIHIIFSEETNIRKTRRASKLGVEQKMTTARLWNMRFLGSRGNDGKRNTINLKSSRVIYILGILLCI
jgi:hypothetical protein